MKVKRSAWPKIVLHFLALLPALLYLVLHRQRYELLTWQPWIIKTPGKVSFVAFWPDTRSILLTRWDLDAGFHPSRPSAHLAEIRTRQGQASWPALSAGRTVVAPDGKTFAHGQSDGRVRLWHITDGETSSPMQGAARGRWLYSLAYPSQGAQEQNPPQLAFSPDSRVLAVGNWHLAQLWDTRTGDLLRTFRIYTWISALGFAANGKSLTVICPSYEGEGDTLQRWSLASAQKLPTLPTKSLGQLRLSPDGKLVAAYYKELGTTVEIRNVSTGRLLRTLELGQDQVEEVLFSSDGQWLIACNARWVRLWNAGSWKLEKTLRWTRASDGGAANSMSVAGNAILRGAFLAPDGSTLACELGDGSVQVWRLR